MKNHPFFEGIDWQMVKGENNEPPFAPIEANIDLGDPLDANTLFESDISEETEAELAEEFRGNYFYHS